MMTGLKNVKLIKSVVLSVVFGGLCKHNFNTNTKVQNQNSNSDVGINLNVSFCFKLYVIAMEYLSERRFLSSEI
jgi:hypothetical protein